MHRYVSSESRAALMLGQSSLTRISPQRGIGVAVYWIHSQVAMGRPIPACCRSSIPGGRCMAGWVVRGGLLVLRGCPRAI